MSIEDSSQTRHRFDKLIAAWHILLERTRELLPARWLLLLAGIGCLAYSQYMMEQRFPYGQPNPIVEQWNILHRLEVVNLSNVLAGLPYFVVGVVLCAWAGMPSSWKEPFVSWSSRWPAVGATKWGKQAPRLLAATGLMVYLLVQLGKHTYVPIDPFLWVIALWLFTRVVWDFDRDYNVDLSLEIKIADILWLLVILAIGIGIGAYALQDIPAVMVPDEGSFWENARAIALGQFRPAFFDSGVYTFPIASTIYQGWMMRLFGVDLWGWRFASVLAGVSALIPLYLLGKEWFGRQVALASAILMLANPYFLSFARLGYNNIQALFPVTLAVYLWALGSRKGSYFYLWLAGLAAGLGFYTYSAAWIGVVTLCLGMVYLRILRQISWKQTFAVFALILLAWGMAFGPRLAYTAAGETKTGLTYKVLETSFFSAFYARAYFGDADLTTIIESDGYPAIFYDPAVYGQLLRRGLVRTLLTLFDPYLVTEHFMISALTGVITPVFFAIGFVLFLRRWKQSRFGLPLIWLVSGLIFLSIIGAFPPRHTHMVSLIPVIALVAGAGLCAVVETLTEHLPASFVPFRAAIISVLIAVLSLVILYAGAKKYFVTMPQTYPPSFEDFASWVALRTEAPVQIIYLGPINVAHRVAYFVNTKMVPHTYMSVDLSVLSLQEYIKPDMPAVLFWEINTPAGLEFLERVPAGFQTPVAYYDNAGNVLGYAATNSPDVRLVWSAGSSGGWSSLTRTPARNILLLLLAGILLAGVFGLWNRFSWPRLSFEMERQAQEEASDPAVETSDTFEVEFSFRIRMSPRKRNRS
ncbi:MAG: glycosyltransferase family 39 protein [Anaerolineales bacterium]|nr:glycosyltransferase family 39 protein [Anaerolineales bacterium]